MTGPRSSPHEPAPIALFAYKRVEHLRRALESLLANPESATSRLFIFCDGAKGEGDAAAVAAVRRLAGEVRGFASATVVASDHNLGLAGSIIAGVTDVLQRSERVIVLEDDLLLSPYFLRYMNDALECYSAEDRVASVHGYVLPVEGPLPETFFLRGADCWGWGTWRRAWQHFDRDGGRLLRELRERRLEHAFDLDGAYRFSAMLQAQTRGENQSWAVRWHASCFLKDMLTLYPGHSLVQNIGTDGSGTHCGPSDALASRLAERPVRVDPIEVRESAAGRAAYVSFYRAEKRRRVGRAWRRATQLLFR